MRANEQIRARSVLVIDADGAKLGVLPVPEALMRARQAGLDLVEVAPGADPPVCRIMNLSKARYEADLKAKAQRRSAHAAEVKEIKLRPAIGENDYQVKLKKLRELLDKGHRVKVTVMLKGRLQSRPEAATDVIARVRADVEDIATFEGAKHQGRNTTAMAVPRSHK